MDFSMKQTLKTLTLTIALLLGSVSVSYAEWTKVSENIDGDVNYVDFERIRKNQKYVYFWELMDFLKPTQFGDLSILTYVEGDCNMFRHRSLQISYYTEHMGRGTRSTFDSNPLKEWKHPRPNSKYENILKSVCSR